MYVRITMFTFTAGIKFEYKVLGNMKKEILKPTTF